MFGHAVPGYAAVWALIVNLIVSVGVSVVVRAIGLKRSDDRTRPEDYLDVVES